MSVSGDTAGALGAFFQTAYVTNDLERAVTLISACYGIAGFYVGDVHGLPQLSGREAQIRAALAWVGSNQIELIQPSGGDDALYRDFLPDDHFAIRLHHFCGRIAQSEDFDRCRHALADRGFPIVVSFERDGLRVFYADARVLLGHYLEYVWIANDGLLTMGGKIPVYAGLPGDSFLPCSRPIC